MIASGCTERKDLLRVVAYCRVSTATEEQATSIELQEQYYAQLIATNPNWVNAGVFCEQVSGLNIEKRPKFQAMMQMCIKRKIDLILTKSISRLGRNTLDVLQALWELQELDIDVYFEKENLWLHDKHTELLITVFCAFAQNESENMSQNIRWGVRQGFRTGTSGYADFACYGYRHGTDGRLVIDETEAAVVRRIFQMRAEGKSLGAISQWLYGANIPSPRGKQRWSRETISKLIKNEKYTGDVLLQKTFVRDIFTGKQMKNQGELDQFLIQEHHEAIVNKELFEIAVRGTSSTAAS